MPANAVTAKVRWILKNGKARSAGRRPPGVIRNMKAMKTASSITTQAIINPACSEVRLPRTRVAANTRSGGPASAQTSAATACGGAGVGGGADETRNNGMLIGLNLQWS